jgi:hypothetical protein
MIAWDWFYGLACECIDAANGDERLGTALMVDRLITNGVPREVWEDECSGYINTAAIRDELQDMLPEDVIVMGLGAGRKH